MDLNIFIGLFAIQLLLILLMLWSNILMRHDEIENSDRSGLSILIPFKNEANRIRDLISSFNHSILSENQKIQIIFIDDHSSDETERIIEQELKLHFEVLRLNENNGKKNALDLGINHAEFEEILTLDADVSFSDSYLSEINKLQTADLTILPVQMEGKNLIENLGTFEFNWLRVFTFSTLASNHPTLCNGANLIFKKSAYMKVKSDRDDFHISSGDDVFLLEAMRNNNLKINGTANAKVSVNTSAPSSLKDLLIQRKRWISKMGNNISISMIIGALFMILVQFGLIYCIFQSFYDVRFLIPIAVKIFGEYILQLFLNYKKNNVLIFFTTLIHQVWYPIYLVMMIFPITDTSRWGNLKYQESQHKYNRTPQEQH